MFLNRMGAGQTSQTGHDLPKDKLATERGQARNWNIEFLKCHDFETSGLKLPGAIAERMTKSSLTI